MGFGITSLMWKGMWYWVCSNLCAGSRIAPESTVNSESGVGFLEPLQSGTDSLRCDGGFYITSVE